MIFDTERLLIRKLGLTDLEAFYDMQGNPKVMQYIKKPMNRFESEKELKRFMNHYENDKVFFNIWAVEQKVDNVFVGICGVYKNEKNEYEIAYRLRQKYWGNGYGKEIAKALIQYGFKTMELNELTAYVHPENLGSLRIIEKEMQFIKKLHCKKSNSIERAYKINRATWLSAKQSKSFYNGNKKIV